MSVETLHAYAVLCAGCKKPVAISFVEHPLRNRVYHNLECSKLKAPSANALRDASIVHDVELGKSVASVAKTFGLSRQRVHAILKEAKES